MMYDQHPCNDGDDYTLSESKGQIGQRPPKWAMPTESGNWFTSLFQQCTKFQRRKGDCWWRSKAAAVLQAPDVLSCVVVGNWRTLGECLTYAPTAPCTSPCTSLV